MDNNKYKNTNMKNIPEGWEWKTLGEVLDYEQPTNYLVSSTEYETQGTPVLTAGKSFILGYTSEKHGIYKDLPVIIFDDFTTDSKFVTMPFKAKSSAMKMLKLKDENFDLRFVFEKMQLIDFDASDHKRHWISEFSKICLPLPPLAEQHRIAAILSDMDAHLAALDALIAKKQAIKKGTMQQLLTGKKRLQGFVGEWKECRLGEVCDFKNGYSFKSELFRTIGEPIIRITNINDGVVDLSDVKYFNLTDYNSDLDSFKIRKGDTLIAMSGATTGKVGKYLSNKVAYLNQRVGKFIPLEEKLYSDFLFHILKKNSNFFYSLAGGGAQPNLSSNQILQFECFLPPSLPEQRAISAILSDMDKEISALQAKRAKYEALKHGAMQRLINVECRM